MSPSLKAQLSQAFAHTTPRDIYSHRCNTPTTRTPSASFSWSQVTDMQSSTNRRQPADEFMDETEDERMVEDMLIQSSPTGGRARTAPSEPSLFTSTDPFYIAQLQSTQHNSPSGSVFAQFGRPSQHSPFQNPTPMCQTQTPPDNFAFQQQISHGSRDNYSPTHSTFLATSDPFSQ